jgi:Domain of unknown function (DUF1772)
MAFVRAIQALSLLNTAFAAGTSLSLSYFSIAVILELPSPILAVRQWHSTFDRGLALVRQLCALSMFTCFYLSYAMYSGPYSSFAGTLYLIGGISAFAIIPWTILIMNGTNAKLFDKSTQVKGLDWRDLPGKEAGIASDSTHKLIKSWGSMNIARTIMLAVTIFVSTWAVFLSI